MRNKKISFKRKFQNDESLVSSLKIENETSNIPVGYSELHINKPGITISNTESDDFYYSFLLESWTKNFNNHQSKFKDTSDYFNEFLIAKEVTKSVEQLLDKYNFDIIFDNKDDELTEKQKLKKQYRLYLLKLLKVARGIRKTIAIKLSKIKVSKSNAHLHLLINQKLILLNHINTGSSYR